MSDVCKLSRKGRLKNFSDDLLCIVCDTYFYNGLQRSQVTFLILWKKLDKPLLHIIETNFTRWFQVLKQTKGRLKQGFGLTKTVFQTTFTTITNHFAI